MKLSGGSNAARSPPSVRGSGAGFRDHLLLPAGSCGQRPSGLAAPTAGGPAREAAPPPGCQPGTAAEDTRPAPACARRSSRTRGSTSRALGAATPRATGAGARTLRRGGPSERPLGLDTKGERSGPDSGRRADLAGNAAASPAGPPAAGAGPRPRPAPQRPGPAAPADRTPRSAGRAGRDARGRESAHKAGAR